MSRLVRFPARNQNNSSSAATIIQLDVSLARYARVKAAAALQAAVWPNSSGEQSRLAVQLKF
jgi:hypothetical protein